MYCTVGSGTLVFVFLQFNDTLFTCFEILILFLRPILARMNKIQPNMNILSQTTRVR